MQDVGSFRFTGEGGFVEVVSRVDEDFAVAEHGSDQSYFYGKMGGCGVRIGEDQDPIPWATLVCLGRLDNALGGGSDTKRCCADVPSQSYR
jgi:hypothetical protein